MKKNSERINNETIEKIEETIKFVGDRGKIFTVSFISKKGKDCIINGRFGVKKFLKGGLDSTRHITIPGTKKLLYSNIYSFNFAGYRKFNNTTVLRIAGRGKVFTFDI